MTAGMIVGMTAGMIARMTVGMIARMTAGDATDEQTHRKFASRDMWINRSFTLNELEKYTMIALRLCTDTIGNFPEWYKWI